MELEKTCVQCSQLYREAENRDGSCHYHCGRPISFGRPYTCGSEGSTDTLCTTGRHREKHHTDYLYAAYISFMEHESANAREVWMEMDAPDYTAPSRYQWAEVGISRNFKLYILVGNEDGCVEFVELCVEELRQITAKLSLIERYEKGGGSARAEIQSISQTCKAVQVSIKPTASSLPLVKRAVFYLHDTPTLTLGRVEVVTPGEPYPDKPSKTYVIPESENEGPELEMNTDIGHSSPGDYKHHSLSENGCPLKLQQVGHTTVFVRQGNSEDGNEWDNVFSATINVTNTSEERLTITETYGEYLNHGNEWVRCDDVTITKTFFPGMYKWKLGSQNFSLSPTFTDNLTAELSIKFSGQVSNYCQPGRAHSSLPQPLQLRVTFVTAEERRSASLRFEQGNPVVIPTRELREKEWKGEMLFYIFADDVNELTRADAAIYHDIHGKLCYRCATEATAEAPIPLWPHLHHAAFHAKQLLQREYELTELKSENGQTSIQVYAMVDPEVGITYALKVVIRTSTSSATGYFLIPYLTSQDFSFSVEPKQVEPGEEITIGWDIPKATQDDRIGLYKSNGKTAVIEEKNSTGLCKSYRKLKAPETPGLYEVRYHSTLWSDQYPSHHQKHWFAGSTVVTAV